MEDTLFEEFNKSQVLQILARGSSRRAINDEKRGHILAATSS